MEKKQVFGVKTEGTPYFEDSLMVTARSSSRADQLARDAEPSNTERGGSRASSGQSRRRFVPRDDSSDDENNSDDHCRKEYANYDDPSDELARQVREVSEMERMNSTPRLKLATHRPLAQIKSFSGLHNKSENSMQWFRTFVYEMKGTRMSGAWPSSWTLEMEHSIGTSNCLARRYISESCSAKRSLKTSMDGYRRGRHHRYRRGYDRRMDDSRHTPRISLAEASLSEMMAKLQVRASKCGRSEHSKSRDLRRSFEDSSSEDVGDRPTCDDQSGSGYGTRTTLTRTIVMSRPPTTLCVEPRQYGHTAGRRTAAAAETSPTEDSAATHAAKAHTDVTVSMDRVRRAGALITLTTTASSAANCVSKCMIPGSVKPSRQ
ncbi:unnamed protein product [Phytophthora fragariaefolia]|uniref:Unnamed protein product n=1 Tax=Phytophthora fragariaefolia TaxID=1490495 RepID=A0A9W6U4T4_9STRA|nr:unnamed protein product [Phytophthora fragariaefolia]